MALERVRRLRSRRSNETFEEWNRETGGKKLPEHVAKQRPHRKRTATKPTRRKTTKKR